MSNGKTKIIDKGYDDIMNSYKKVNGASVDIGIMKAELYPNNAKVKGEKAGGATRSKNITVTEIAIVHEFGSEKAGIPERSFLRSTADEKRVKYKSVLVNLMIQVENRSLSVKEALSLFGERVVGDVKRKITSIRRPPNAPSTIADKGFDNPLIRTGTLRSRIKKRVNL